MFGINYREKYRQPKNYLTKSTKSTLKYLNDTGQDRGVARSLCDSWAARRAQVSGMVLLIGGIYLRMDVRVNHVMITAYADDVRWFHWFCYGAVAAGAVVTFIGFLGCCSAYQESKCMLAAVRITLTWLYTAFF